MQTFQEICALRLARAPKPLSLVAALIVSLADLTVLQIMAMLFAVSAATSLAVVLFLFWSEPLEAGTILALRGTACILMRVGAA